MPAALDQVFKAYDVRGVYPDQLDEELAERVGRAFVALTGAGTLAIGQDMRPSSKPMADALAAGAMAQGADVLRVGLCSTDMLYYVSGALDVAGVMLTASHNPARYNGLKLCRPGAVPVGEESGLADIKRMVAAGEPAAAAADRGPRAPGRRPAGALRRPRAELRRPGRAAAPQGGRRRRQRHGRARGPGRLRRPAVRAGVDVLRAGRQLPQPPGRPAEPREPPRAPGQGGGRGRRRRAGLRRRRRPGVPGRRAGRDRALEPGRGPGGPADVRARAGRDRALQPDLLPGRARDDPRGRRGPGPDPGRPQLHQGRDGRDRGHLRLRALRALLLPRQLPGRLGPDRRPGRPGRPVAGGQAAVGGARPLPPLRRLGGDQPPRRRPGQGHRRRWPRATRRMRPTSPTG